MLSEENKKNLDSFKTAMRQEVRNAGYFLEDIPDLLREKKLEQAYEKQLAAKEKLEELKREATIYRLRLKDCGYPDIEDAYRQTKEQREEAEAAYSALFDRYAQEISQIETYQKKDRRMGQMVAVSLSCMGIAWIFSFVLLFFIGIVMLIVTFIASRGVKRARALAKEQMPPDLLAAEEKKAQTEEEYQKVSRAYEWKQHYEELQASIQNLEKSAKGMT